ncbi:RICIN domain-containing protein [Streptomyces sp. NBC_00448]|uniref:RICIN domain-containing protein n=1 Tax=Streptomyces sp. NBC_00448 TaxID=2903652 RepID=UPI002E22C7EB
MPRLRRALAAVAATASLLTVGTVLPAVASPAPAAASYTVSIGSTKPYAYADDTPASGYIDKNGTFYFQSSHSLYGATDPREWGFYTGTDFDTATPDTTLDTAVNPADAKDANNDTTWRCNNSPTGLEATPAPTGSGYSQANYCDLLGVWVDPDTGDWYGLVHNEFTPQPFGDGLHYDSIDYAVSTDQGKVWSIKGHAITSPYRTTRGDTATFPQQTYDYGDGDQRFYVDTASGYFYVYYGSRIVPKGGVGGSMGGLENVARAPISGKMATGSWQKWFDGSWSQPGVGGRESNLEPVTAADPTGYTPVADDYDPKNTGTVDQQIAAGELPDQSPLFIMNITYDAYLGLYIGEPAVAAGTTQSQKYYATDNLATQKWHLIGDSGGYTSGSWYRWFLDSANNTSSTIVGRSFRSYCAIACSHSDGEYANETIDSSAPAAPPVDPAESYRISSGTGRVLAQVSGGSATTSLTAGRRSERADWSFVSNGDGSYQIVNAATRQALGVDSRSTASRAWGTGPTVTTVGKSGPTVGQEWFVVAGTDPRTGKPTGTYRLVNRYSELVLGMSAQPGRLAETTPTRSWTDRTGDAVGGSRSAAEQTLSLTAAGPVPGPEQVSVYTPGAQTATVGTAASVQVNATDSAGRKLRYAASGLPTGLTISSTGLITGTPTAAGTYTATVTASSGRAGGSTRFAWTVDPLAGDLSGTHTVSLSGQALEDPDSSQAEGTQLDTSALTGGQNQSWTFTRLPDGSYTLTNGSSGQCAADNGGFTTPGTTVIQWPCPSSVNLDWRVTELLSGAYTLTSVNSGLLLTTASTANGAPVTQQPDTGSALQQWTIE